MSEKLAAVTAGEDVAAAVTVEVPDAARCPRYTARVIDNVKVGPSPRMARRARDCCRGPFHQQRRGRDELHPVPATASRCTPSISRQVASADGCAHIVVRAAADGETPYHPGRGGSRADERHDGHRHTRAAPWRSPASWAAEIQRGHRGDHLRAFGVRRLRARPHLPHEPQSGPYLREPPCATSAVWTIICAKLRLARPRRRFMAEVSGGTVRPRRWWTSYELSHRPVRSSSSASRALWP